MILFCVVTVQADQGFDWRDCYKSVTPSGREVWNCPRSDRGRTDPVELDSVLPAPEVDPTYVPRMNKNWREGARNAPSVANTTWMEREKAYGSRFETTYEFLSDGRFIEKTQIDNRPQHDLAGFWSQEGDRVFMVIRFDNVTIYERYGTLSGKRLSGVYYSVERTKSEFGVERERSYNFKFSYSRLK